MRPLSEGEARRLRLDAPAKLNLHLEVLRRREDGYHDIETILQAVDLFDRLEIELSSTRDPAAPRRDLQVEPTDAVPEGPENLCLVAAERFMAATGLCGDLRIRLRKAIPVGAGLGGGSSDAAAVLVGLDRLFDTRLGAERLEAIGAEIGADVPFFVRGGTQIGRGIGTDLHPMCSPSRGRFLIVKPALKLATRSVYERLNMGLTSRSPKVNIRRTEALLARLPAGAWFGINRLEEVVIPEHPVLQRLLIDLQEKASFAMMTGSGAALFAICEDDRQGEALARELSIEDAFVRIVAPYTRGATIRED